MYKLYYSDYNYPPIVDIQIHTTQLKRSYQLIADILQFTFNEVKQITEIYGSELRIETSP